MKLNDRKLLEDQIRHMDGALYNPSPRHIEEIKRRAFRLYMARQSWNQQPEFFQPQGAKRKGILHRMAIVCAAAVCLMVVSFLYSALAPVTISSANNVVRRAAIWVNDQLHLGIMFPEPVSDAPKRVTTESSVFFTLEEAAQNTNLPIIYLMDDSDLELQSISISPVLNGKASLSIHYAKDNQNLSIAVYPNENSSALSFSATNYCIVSSCIGAVYACETEDGVNAYLFYDDYSIRINASLGYDDFCLMLQYLALFN